MARRPGRKERIRTAFDRFHAAASSALGAAEANQDRAARAHAETMAELWLRDVGIDAARRDPGLLRVLGNPAFAGPGARAQADRDEVFTDWQGGSPELLSELVRAAAPGSAGLPADRWLGTPGRLEATGPVPGLWHVGTGSVEGGDPFPVGVPLLDESHLQITSTPGTRDEAEALVESLLMRVLSHFRPGVVGVHVWDVGRFTGALPGLYPLTRSGLLTVHDPAQLGHLLGQLSERIRRVHTRVLSAGHPSLRSLAEQTGARPEPWLLAVLAGNRQALSEQEHRQLQRVARGGAACGVALVLLDVPIALGASVETIDLTDPEDADAGRMPARPRVRTSMTGPHVQVTPDPPVPAGDVARACDVLVDEHERWRGRLGAFADLLPGAGSRGSWSSAGGLYAPIGFEDGIPVGLTLDDASPHALVGGPSGSGKTNLLLAWISSLAAHYPPAEAELYLLDFKEGVSFAQFAPDQRDTGALREGWLPHARLIGVNINTDREFGLALLRHLSEEMRRRAEAAKRYGVTKLAELREAVAEAGVGGPDAHWPRIVAVVDEFQFLFAERDAVTTEATSLLEDVARRGRSQGIHLVFASQDVSGIEAFWGRPAIFEQFVLRIALPRARRVLANLNDAAMELPRWHAVVNHESGVAHGNQVVSIPEAGGTVVRQVQEDAFAAFPPDPGTAPVVFDGARAPTHDDLVAAMDRTGPPQALVGQRIDVAGSPATVGLPAAPGRNLGVLGVAAPPATRMLCSAAASLGEQLDDARFVLVSLVEEAAGPVDDLAGVLGRGHQVEKVGLDGFADRVTELTAEVDRRHTGGERDAVVVVVFGVDAADAVLDRAGTEALRRLVHYGPETGMHVLGWWRSVARLKTLLTGLGVGLDDLGAWVALDVLGGELGPLVSGPAPSWSPTPGRGLFLDRARGGRPQVVIAAEWRR